MVTSWLRLPPKGRGTVLLSGTQKSRKVHILERNLELLTANPSPYFHYEGRMFEKALGRRASRGYGNLVLYAV